MLRTLLPILTTSLLALSACATKVGPVVIGQPAPPLSLKGFGNREFSIDAPRTNPLVLVFSNREARQDAMLWVQRVRATDADCQILLVMDASGGFPGRRGAPGGTGSMGGGPPAGGGFGGRGGRAAPADRAVRCVTTWPTECVRAASRC